MLFLLLGHNATLSLFISKVCLDGMMFNPFLLLSSLCRFLEEEYIDYCVPSNVSSGLGGLPLSSVWYKGKENKSWPTDPTLPNGDKLDGPYSYSLIMPYFTTNNMTPIDVHNLGKKQLDKLYPMVRTFSNSLIIYLLMCIYIL